MLYANRDSFLSSTTRKILSISYRMMIEQFFAEGIYTSTLLHYLYFSVMIVTLTPSLLNSVLTVCFVLDLLTKRCILSLSEG